MNEDDEFMNAPQDNDGHAVVRTVFDGELVDDDQAVSGTEFPRRSFRAWWRHSPRVPRALKTREALRQALADLGKRILLSPFWFTSAVGRGVVVAARAWRRWVRVHDYREAAELSEKLADKFVEIRALTLFRWKVTGR